MKNTYLHILGNASYSRQRAQEERFNYLDTYDRYILSVPKASYKLAVIGTGLMGRSHIDSIYVEGRGDAAGIYDPHLGSIQAALKECGKFTQNVPKVYRSIDEAVSDSDIDGFIISTPNNTHAQVLEKVLEAGKPVFLEKPMATTVEDAYRITAMVRESGVPVQVGLQYRFKAMYVEAIKEACRLGSVGDIKTISIREHRIPFLDKVGQWNKFSASSGGTLVEKCCHYFDLFNLFARSRPSRVFASGSQAASYRDFSYKGERSDILDNAYMIVDYENGVRAAFDLCMFVPLFYEELVICGDGGRIRAYEQEDFLSKDSFETGFEIYRGEYHPSRTCSPRYQGAIADLGHSGADFFAQSAFMDLIEGDGENSPTVEEGFWSVVIGAAAQESVLTGVPVDV